MRFLQLVKPVLWIIPEVQQPERKVSVCIYHRISSPFLACRFRFLLKEKLLWTVLSLFIFLLYVLLFSCRPFMIDWIVLVHSAVPKFPSLVSNQEVDKTLITGS